VPGLLREPKPSVTLAFGDWGIELTLNCSVARYVDQYAVQAELRKRILRRFRAEGIAIARRLPASG
jgi:small-conductance mechanosensitive channel